MRRLLDGLLTSVVLIFFVPTILILISWNAIPGDGLYPIKSFLENATLVILSGTPLVPKISMKYTDRRLYEATILLDKKGSSVGYDLLVAEAAQTQNYISEKNDSESAVKFSENIDGYKQQIEKKKAEIITQQSLPTIQPTALPSSKPTTIQITELSSQTNDQTTIVVNVPQVVVIKQENPEEVLKKLDDVEKKLDDIQQKVKDDVNKGSSKNNNQKKDKNNQDKSSDTPGHQKD